MMKASAPHRSASQTEHGLIMVLTAILLFAFFMIAALALDFSQMAVGNEQGLNNARFAALSALQAYSQAPDDKTVEEKIEIALAQANTAGSLNKNLTFGGKQTADTLTTAGTTGPKLIAGKYYAEAPTALCSNPCTNSQSPPCFVTLSEVNTSCEASGTIGEPNAFRVVGNFYSDLRTTFSKIIGWNAYAVPVDVIAAFTPRRGMFLVDISASAFQDTHWYDKTSPDYPSFYSYYLQPDNGTAGATYYDSSWGALNASRASPPPGAPNSSSASYDTLHYRSDYAVVSSASFGSSPTPSPTYTGRSSYYIRMLKDTDYTAAGEEFGTHHPDPSTSSSSVNYRADQHQGTFHIDTYRDASYAGPEPFTTIFRGLDSAVDSFKQRAVTGDKLGIVFFDQNLVWPRVINLTDDFNYIKKFTDISVYNDDNYGLQKVLRHGIFPSAESMSNLLMATTEAVRQFDRLQASSVASVDFIVYFGDGFANCVINVGAVGPPGTNACGDDYSHYRQAIQELRQFALSTLYPRRISFNTILVGGSAGPHVLALSNGAGGCMSDTEARNAELEYVRGMNLPAVPANPYDPSYNTNMGTWSAAYNSKSDSNPFYQVDADMYRIARATGGIWGPLRPYTTDQTLCNPGCTSTDPATAPRIRYSCSPTSTDVNRYIREEIMNANPYMIVPGS